MQPLVQQAGSVGVTAVGEGGGRRQKQGKSSGLDHAVPPAFAGSAAGIAAIDTRAVQAMCQPKGTV
jgi:hypothetical protein